MMRALYHVKLASELEREEMQRGHALERNTLTGLGSGALSGLGISRVLPMPNVPPEMVGRTRAMTGLALGSILAAAGIGSNLAHKHLSSTYGDDVPGAERTDYNPVVPAALQTIAPAAGVLATSPIGTQLIKHFKPQSMVGRLGLRLSTAVPSAVAGKLLADYLERKYQE